MPTTSGTPQSLVGGRHRRAAAGALRAGAGVVRADERQPSETSCVERVPMDSRRIYESSQSFRDCTKLADARSSARGSGCRRRERNHLRRRRPRRGSRCREKDSGNGPQRSALTVASDLRRGGYRCRSPRARKVRRARASLVRRQKDGYVDAVALTGLAGTRTRWRRRTRARCRPPRARGGSRRRAPRGRAIRPSLPPCGPPGGSLASASAAPGSDPPRRRGRGGR